MDKVLRLNAKLKTAFWCQIAKINRWIVTEIITSRLIINNLTELQLIYNRHILNIEGTLIFILQLLIIALVSHQFALPYNTKLPI